MNARELHQKLKQRINDAKLDSSDLRVVEAYLDDENKYYELLAACFTRLNNNQNQFFIDVIKSKDGSPIDNEHLGFLLNLASQNNELKNLPQENLDEELFYKLSDSLIRKGLIPSFEYRNLLQFLKNDNNLKKYTDWFWSCSRGYYPNYASFFSLIYTPSGRGYLDSLLDLTFNRPILFDYAQLLMKCYSFHDEKLNTAVLIYAQALTALAQGKLDDVNFNAFYTAAAGLDRILQAEPYAQRFVEEKNNMLKRMGLHSLCGLSVVGVFTAIALAVVLPLCFPTLGLGLTLAIPLILQTLSLIGMVATPMIAQVVYGSKEDAPILAKKILKEGKGYSQFFKESKKQQEEKIPEGKPIIDFAMV